jgi:hypothetical protein
MSGERGKTMVARITFFPVGNGDMTFLELESGKRILIDLNIRKAADDEDDDDTPDVASILRDRMEHLGRDSEGRLFVDAFLVSHPDADHCGGVQKHLHLGAPDNWSSKDDKIFVREIWSSPIVFRRASKNHTLCDDAKAFAAEARRRVARFRDSGSSVGDGDRILILGEDEKGKTDDLEEILVHVGETFTRINGEDDAASVSVLLLGPLPQSGDEEDEEALAKNRSSTILRFSIAGGGVPHACRFLTAGDAEVAIWERLWQDHAGSPDVLSYHILQSPHHCSWHSLSYDSWSEKGEDAEVCNDARDALAQALDGAAIVASSKAIKDDDSDPPCIRAKREYQEICKGVGGTFHCVGEPEDDPDCLVFEIGRDGPRNPTRRMKSSSVIGAGALGRHKLPHG